MRPLFLSRTIPFILLAVSGFYFAGCDGKPGPAGPAGQATTVIYVPVTATPTITPTPPTHAFITKWGSAGTGNSQFDGLMNIKVNSAGTTVYVQDYNNSRIQYFGNSGSYLGQIPIGGYDFSLVSDGATIIATDIGTIRLYDSAGATITTIGNYGSGPGSVVNPYGTYLDAFSNLYVVDNGNNRVEVFSFPAGNYITHWGFTGTGAGQFTYPLQIVPGLNGNLYVSDSSTHRIEVFTPSGTFLFQFTVPDSPVAMAVSPVNQNIFLAIDASVYEYFPNGGLWTQFGTSGGGDGQFDCPNGIAVDNAGNIYVGDSCANRVQKFAP